jgi:hypothetical protein
MKPFDFEAVRRVVSRAIKAALTSPRAAAAHRHD